MPVSWIWSQWITYESTDEPPNILSADAVLSLSEKCTVISWSCGEKTNTYKHLQWEFISCELDAKLTPDHFLKKLEGLWNKFSTSLVCPTVYVCNIPKGNDLCRTHFDPHWARSCSYSREKLFILIFFL